MQGCAIIDPKAGLQPEFLHRKPIVGVRSLFFFRVEPREVGDMVHPELYEPGVAAGWPCLTAVELRKGKLACLSELTRRLVLT